MKSAKKPSKILVIGHLGGRYGDDASTLQSIKTPKSGCANRCARAFMDVFRIGLYAEIANAIEMPIGHGELKLGERIRIGKALRANQYDQAIVVPNSFKSALIPFIARIPVRTGWLGEARYFLLNDYRKLDKKRYPLMVEQCMALACQQMRHCQRLIQIHPSM